MEALHGDPPRLHGGHRSEASESRGATGVDQAQVFLMQAMSTMMTEMTAQREADSSWRQSMLEAQKEEADRRDALAK